MFTLMLFGLVYFLPTIIAVRRGHPGTGIFLTNLFLGWTCIAWFVLIAYAVSLPYVYPAEPYTYGYREYVPYGAYSHYDPYYNAYGHPYSYGRRSWSSWHRW